MNNHHRPEPSGATNQAMSIAATVATTAITFAPTKRELNVHGTNNLSPGACPMKPTSADQRRLMGRGVEDTWAE